MAKYTYNISDFTSSVSNVVALRELTEEITGSAISGTLYYINRTCDIIDIYYSGSISAGDEIILSGVIGSHSGIPISRSGENKEDFLTLDGLRVMLGDLDMGTQDIINVNLVDGVDVSSHADRHEYNGVDEIDGDILDIDFNPTYYIPTSASTGGNIDHLAAHLKGIDTAISSAVASGAIGPVYGDLSGYLPYPTVSSIQNIPVTGQIPIENDMFIYDSGSGQWILIQSGNISASALPHANTHILGGSDEIDGDQLDIDFAPISYTPISASTGGNVDHLAAHLAGIDTAISAANLANIFGSNFNYSQTSCSFSTTADTFQQAHTITFSAINSGVYRIAWDYVWSYDSVSYDFISRIQLDNTIDLQDPYHRQEPNDTQGSGDGGTNQRFVASYFRYINLISGSHTIDLDIRSEQAGVDATIHSGAFEVWRVS